MVVAPYSTCEVEGWSVVQVMVAEVAVMLVEITALITGSETGVAKVKLADVAEPPALDEIAA